MYNDVSYTGVIYEDVSGNGKYGDSADITHKGKTYYPSDLKRGDLIAYGTDNDGVATDFTLIYSGVENKMISTWHENKYTDPAKGELITMGSRVYAGFVYRKYDDGLSYVVTDNINDVENGKKNLYYTSITNFVYYDAATNKVYPADITTLKTWVEDEEKASRIVIHANECHVHTVLIIDNYKVS